MALYQDSVTQSERYQPLLGSADAAYACYARSFAQAWGSFQSVPMSRLSWFMTAYLDVKFVLIRRPIIIFASDKYGSKKKVFNGDWIYSCRDRDPSQLSPAGISKRSSQGTPMRSRFNPMSRKRNPVDHRNDRSN